MVRAGYKRTEVGVIPEDWEVKPLESLAVVERGKFAARPRNDPKYYGGDIPFIQTGDVTNAGVWIRSHSQTLNQAGLQVSRLFPQGTLFFTIAANIGDVGFAAFETACPDSLVAIAAREGVDGRWLAYELGKQKQAFENLASHNAQMNLNLEKLRPYLLSTPPQAEQDAIGNALSDADALIESLEQLLVKKRQIKRGAMQELLTGKRRLPGFEVKAGYKQTEVGLIPEDWELKLIQDIADIKTGPFGTLLKASEYAVGEGVPLISVGEIREGFLRVEADTPRVPVAVTRRLPQYVLRKGDIVFGRKGGVERSALIREGQVGWFLGSDGICARASDYCDDEYLAFQFHSDRVRAWLLQNAIGTTMPSLNQEILRRIAVCLPSSKAEQTAIAEILSDIDTEITTLEQKLQKARQLKQGMMRELLTGRIRLVL